ncbi:MAG TPA: hypothetical protein VGO37_19590 [Steroidobacteraceae bacterium]|nr:hypothetical protein [Steroidobacteraceae bacterium]
MPNPISGIYLRDGAITVGIAPECGGALTRFEVRRQGMAVAVLRPAIAPEAGSHCALGASSFPLIPYGGRLRQGRFEFDGRRYQFPLNALPERHSSHGDGWIRPWTLDHLGRRDAVMSLEADEAAPFQYRCTQTIAIADDRVSIELSARNLSSQRIPMGFGLHPYFANRSDARLKAALPVRWLWDEELMPVRPEVNPDAAGFLRHRRVSELPVTAEYADWNGRATIEWPTMHLRVELETQPALKHAVFWMPKGQDFFCFEPLAHATDALNGHPMRPPAEDFVVLEPDATATQRFDFVISFPDSFRHE